MAPQTPQRTPYGSRINAGTAREFAYAVHTSTTPVLFRVHQSRSEANSRCWEWNKKRPVFKGLGVSFFVQKLGDGKHAQYGIFGRPSSHVNEFIVHDPVEGPLLRLAPAKESKEIHD